MQWNDCTKQGGFEGDFYKINKIHFDNLIRSYQGNINEYALFAMQRENETF